MIHPAVRDLFLELGKHPHFQDALRWVASNNAASRNASGNGASSNAAPASAVSVSGLTTTAKALYAVLLWQHVGRPLVIVVDGNKEAETLSETLQTFFTLVSADDRNAPQLLPALDVLPLQNLSPHAEILE